MKTENGVLVDATVAELIAELEKIENKDNVKVRIQYRDEGGDYYGTDEYLYFSTKVEENTDCIVL